MAIQFTDFSDDLSAPTRPRTKVDTTQATIVDNTPSSHLKVTPATITPTTPAGEYLKQIPPEWLEKVEAAAEACKSELDAYCAVKNTRDTALDAYDDWGNEYESDDPRPAGEIIADEDRAHRIMQTARNKFERCLLEVFGDELVARCKEESPAAFIAETGHLQDAQTVRRYVLNQILTIKTNPAFEAKMDAVLHASLKHPIAPTESKEPEQSKTPLAFTASAPTVQSPYGALVFPPSPKSPLTDKKVQAFEDHHQHHNNADYFYPNMNLTDIANGIWAEALMPCNGAAPTSGFPNIALVFDALVAGRGLNPASGTRWQDKAHKSSASELNIDLSGATTR